MNCGRDRIHCFILGWVVASGVLPMIGCSNTWSDRWRRTMPATYASSGTVTFRGKPLDGATVIFHPQEGAAVSQRAASGLTDPRGRFTLTTVKPGDGAVAGTFLVTVHKSSGEIPGAVTTPPDDFGAFPLAVDPSSGTSLIPEKYATPSTSGLSAEVLSRRGNDFTFTLE
jgi:hypothetical protein